MRSQVGTGILGGLIAGFVFGMMQMTDMLLEETLFIGSRSLW